MAFMVPVVQSGWDIYGTGSGKNSRRSSQQSRSAPQSRRASQASGGLSRQTSASSSGSAATTPSFSMHGPCFSSSRGPPGSCRTVSRADSSASGDSSSAQRCVTFGPPSPPCAGKPGGKQAEKHNFHTKVVDKLMRVLHRGEKEGTRRS